MIYEGLYIGLRKATGLTMRTWFEDSTHEQYFAVDRTFKQETSRLWTMKVAEVALREQRADEHCQEELFKKAEEICKEILDEIDWNTFFPLPEPEKKKLSWKEEYMQKRV